MNTSVRSTISIAFLFGVLGCSDGAFTPSGGDTSGTIIIDEEAVALPSQDEEDAIAEVTITQDNADAAFRDLQAEIDADIDEP